MGVGERQVGPAQPHEKAAGHHPDPAAGHRVQAGGHGGAGELARGPQMEAGAGLGEEQPEERRQQVAEVDERVVHEQDRPEHRDPGQHRHGQGRETRRGLADQAGAEVVGEPGAEQGQGQAGDHLVALEHEADHPVQRGEQPPGQAGGDKGQPWAAGQAGGDERGQAADEHHPFDAEVKHARLLGAHLPQGGVEQRCAGDHRRGQEGHKQFGVHGCLAGTMR